ncbi:hypothetical protein YC2023_018312 [Brassica napus]
MAQQIGSGLHGLGIGAIGLDWSTISSYLGSPLTSPWSVLTPNSLRFATANVGVGFVLAIYVLIPICYWLDVYKAKTFPLFSSSLFTNEGSKVFCHLTNNIFLKMFVVVKMKSGIMKVLIIYLDGPTYFSKDSKNDFGDDTWLQKNINPKFHIPKTLPHPSTLKHKFGLVNSRGLSIFYHSLKVRVKVIIDMKSGTMNVICSSEDFRVSLQVVEDLYGSLMVNADVSFAIDFILRQKSLLRNYVLEDLLEALYFRRLPTRLQKFDSNLKKPAYPKTFKEIIERLERHETKNKKLI